MNKRFSYDNMLKARSIEPTDIIRTFKLDRCCDFMEEKYNNPKLTQKEICKQLGVTDRTIRRFRDDIKMDSPYRTNIPKKKKPKQTPDTSTSQTQQSTTNESNKNKIIEKRIKNRLKNEIKGGNILDSQTTAGREIISENKQEHNIEHGLSNDYRKMTGKQLIEEAFKTTIND